jgi:hypothetical protein
MTQSLSTAYSIMCFEAEKGKSRIDETHASNQCSANDYQMGYTLLKTFLFHREKRDCFCFVPETGNAVSLTAETRPSNRLSAIDYQPDFTLAKTLLFHNIGAS